MNPVSAYIDALSKYFDYRGTISRREYWMFMIATYIIYAIIIGVGLLVFRLCSPWDEMELARGLYGGENSHQIGIYLFSIVGVCLFIVFFAVTLPSLSLMARRLNDMGWSRWWLLVFLIPFCPFMPSFIICLPVIILGCVPGCKNNIIN
jgi:uncharacterized membrane protein YhaH (DUF805 family)